MSKIAQRLSKYENTTFKFYETARHGYLLVPNEIISDFEIRFTITPFSFQTKIDKKTWVYLEEDCDAGTFIEAYKAYYGKEPKMIQNDRVLCL